MMTKPINLRRKKFKDTNTPVLVITRGKHAKYGIIRIVMYKAGMNHTGAELGTYLSFFFHRNCLYLALYPNEQPNTLKFTGRPYDNYISCQSIQLAKTDIRPGNYLIGEADDHEEYPEAVVYSLKILHQ